MKLDISDETIGDMVNISNSALAILIDRSKDLDIPPIMTLFIFRFLINENIKDHKRQNTNPPIHISEKLAAAAGSDDPYAVIEFIIDALVKDYRLRIKTGKKRP